MADSNEFDGFINIFGDRHKSFVWEHFLFNKETKQSKCRHCQNVLKVVGGSTTGMRTHLKSIHAELVSEFANKSVNESFQDDQEVIDVDENDDKIQELNLDPVEVGQIDAKGEKPKKRFYPIDEDQLGKSYWSGSDHWEDVSEERHSEVWKHFLLNKKLRQAKCHHCDSVPLSIKHGSTSSLINHLNQKHDIHFDKNEIDQIEKPSVKDEEIYDEDLIEDFSIKDQGLNQCYQLV